MCTQPPPLSLTRNMFKVAIKFQSNLISHTFFLLNFTLSSEERKRDVEWLRKQTKKYLCNTFLISSRLIYLSPQNVHILMCYFMLPAQWCTYRNRFRYMLGHSLQCERERESLRRFFRSQEVIKWRFFFKINYFCEKLYFFLQFKKVRWSPFEVHLDLKNFSSLKFRILCECY